LELGVFGIVAIRKLFVWLKDCGSAGVTGAAVVIGAEGGALMARMARLPER
jgi:hypothetical protein